MTATLFIDESKSNGFRFAVSRIDNDAVDTVRKGVRRIAASHARRFHATHESAAAKRHALDILAALPSRISLSMCRLAARGLPHGKTESRGS